MCHGEALKEPPVICSVSAGLVNKGCTVNEYDKLSFLIRMRAFVFLNKGVFLDGDFCFSEGTPLFF
jgi:hypothetical protein